MESELKVWLDWQTSTREDEADLILALKSIFGPDRVQPSEYGHVTVSRCSPDSLGTMEKLSNEFRLPLNCRLTERRARSELRRIRFALLTIEGDPVDYDAKGEHLNHFGSYVCSACWMPDETIIPTPFSVSVRQMRRRRQDGVTGYVLPTKREIFWSSWGIFVVSDRVKQILEALEQPVRSAPCVPASETELPCSCWAIQPVHTWGEDLAFRPQDPCPSCGTPRRCHTHSDEECPIQYENRIILRDDAIPELDLTRSVTWYGDRSNRCAENSRFIRHVFVSGRLYEVLLSAGVRGLMQPEQVVAINDSIPMFSEESAAAWINSKLEVLKARGLI